MPKLTIGGDARGAIKAVTDLAKAQKELAEGGTKAAKRLTDVEKAARRIQEANDPQKRYNRQIKDTARLANLNKISLQDAQRAALRYGRNLERAGRAGKGSLGALQSQLQTLALSALGGGGVLGAVTSINRAYDTWIQNTREISDETQKAQDELVAFAALQEGGTRAARVRSATSLATRFGVSSRGEAFNTVQALQSARGGNFEEGLKAAAVVFAASQVGVPVALGRELELLGAGQGQASGQALRRAFVAGEESSRDPKAIASAAPAFKFFNDKDFGNAVAAALAGSVAEGELKTFVKQAGVALSSVSSVQGKFEKLGLGKATQQQRLEKLSELGIDTPEELKQFGFNEIRQIEALAGLVPNVKNLNRISSAIREKAIPGLFALKRGGIESELPNSKRSREVNILGSAFKDELAFGGLSGAALEEEKTQRIRGLAFQKFGATSVLGIDTIDEEGRSTKFDEMIVTARVNSQMMRAILEEMQRIRGEVETGTTEQKRTADATTRKPVAGRAE